MSGGNYSENFSTLSTWTGIAQGATTVTYAASPVITAPTRFQRPASNTTNNTMTTGSALPSSLTTINAFSTSAVAGTGTQNIGTSKMVMLASGTGNAAGLDLFLDFTGRNAGTLAFDWASVANGTFTAPSTNNRFGTLQVWASVNGTTWIQIGSDIVAQNNALDPGVANPAGAGGSFSASLPASFNGSSTARVRFYVHSVATAANNPAAPATGGNRPKISIDDIAVTSTAAGAPTFTPATGPIVTPVTTTASPSTGVSVSFGGADLTSDVTASVTAPFEVASAIGGPYGPSATINQNLLGSLFVRLNPAAAGSASGTISYTGGGVLPSITGTTSVTGNALAVQPTTQPTLAITGTTANSVSFTLTGGDAAKTLVIARSGSPYQDQSGFQASNLPVDGQAYSASQTFGSGGTVGTAGVFAVVSGTSVSFTVIGLTGGTQYSFVAFGYNDDNTAGAQNYLGSGIPVASVPGTLAGNVVTTTTDLAPGTAYTWSGPANGLWSLDTNWTPTRTTPASNDFIEIPAGSSILYDVAADQTIGNLTVSGAGIATISLSGATTRTLTVSFAPAGNDFSIPAGATLRLRNGATTGTALNLTIGAGSNGNIAGTLDLDGTSAVNTAPELFTATGTVVVPSGGQVTVGSFATGASVTGGGVTFQNGSTLTKNGGTTPTAVFQPTSNFIWNVNGQIGLSGRTYGNLTLQDHSNASSTGGSPLVINNLTYSATGKTLNMNLTGGITINGDLNVTAGTLNFQPASSSALTFTKATPTITATEAGPIAMSNITLTKQGGGTLTINNVATGANALTLAAGTNLAVSNSLTFNAGSLASGGNTVTILSDGTTQAYVRNVGVGTVTGGSATVQRAVNDVTPYTGIGYRHYAAPVTGADVADLTTGSFTPVVNAAYNSAPNPSLPGAVVPFPNMFSYDPTLVLINSAGGFLKGYQSPTGSADPLTVGKGYSVRKNTSMVDFVGALNSGNRTLTLNGNGTLGAQTGWNLLGNPYPSGLDWKKVRDAAAIPAGMSTTIALYRPTGTTSGFYDYTSGLALDDYNDLGVAQGFFARKTNSAPAANVNLTNAMRSTTGGNSNFNRQAPVTSVTPVPAVKLAISNIIAPAIQPKTAVYFDANATLGYDDYYDGMAAGRSDGDVPTLASLINGEEAAVNALPTQVLGGADVVVPMLVATPLDGYYKISVYKMLDLPAGIQVVLEDAVTGASQDLTSNPTYSFHSDANYAGQRFTLRFTAGRVTGLATDLSASALSLYPNPATGSVRVSAAAGSVVRVFDAVGRQVRTLRIDAVGTETTLSLTGLQAGLYTVRAGAASQKLVVQ